MASQVNFNGIPKMSSFLLVFFCTPNCCCRDVDEQLLSSTSASHLSEFSCLVVAQKFARKFHTQWRRDLRFFFLWKFFSYNSTPQTKKKIAKICRSGDAVTFLTGIRFFFFPDYCELFSAIYYSFFFLSAPSRRLVEFFFSLWFANLAIVGN